MQVLVPTVSRAIARDPSVLAPASTQWPVQAVGSVSWVQRCCGFRCCAPYACDPDAATTKCRRTCTMYVGPWQEYRLAKLRSDAVNEIKEQFRHLQFAGADPSSGDLQLDTQRYA